MRRTWSAMLLGVALLPAVGGVAFSLAAEPEDAEGARYNLMAVFLYNFASFIEWPADSALSQGPITIGVLGANPFGSAVAAIEKKTVNGRALTFRSFASPSEVQPIHILFVAKSAARQMDEVRRVLRGHPVLTVGETEDFTRQGGVVRFYEVETGAGRADPGRNLRLEINERLARDLNLQIRSKLLRLATVVDYPAPDVP